MQTLPLDHEAPEDAGIPPSRFHRWLVMVGAPSLFFAVVCALLWNLAPTGDALTHFMAIVLMASAASQFVNHTGVILGWWHLSKPRATPVTESIS